MRTAPSSLLSTMPTQMYRVTSTPMVRPISYRSLAGGASEAHQFVDAVEGRLLITFRECGIVKNRLHEIIDCALQDHHCLPDVQQFRRPFADYVNSQNLARFAMKNNLQPP